MSISNFWDDTVLQCSITAVDNYIDVVTVGKYLFTDIWSSNVSPIVNAIDPHFQGQT